MKYILKIPLFNLMAHFLYMIIRVAYAVVIDGGLEASIDGVHHVLAGEGLDPVRVVGVVLHVPEEAVAPHTPALRVRPLNQLVRLVKVVLAPERCQSLRMVNGSFFNS